MAISWAGVGDALRGTVIDSPNPSLSVPAEARGARPLPPAASGSASGGPGPASSRPVVSPTRARPSASRTPAKRPPDAGPSAGDRLSTSVVRAGRVVFALGADSARLVRATPGPGFQVKVWQTSTWIRVDLTDGTHGSTVIASWNDHPPIVQVNEF
ncbi:hypothetical protein DZF91_38665 [Actinomadura logoneensis]|uniref:Uncharacterized protein n=2 Tax=Actinomadura logoneensis TaxID=2293572 RepID=A0A372J967_9ACTN|nr:hypothetical protein DZF91_38665 [Actinomadura logoneensis]